VIDLITYPTTGGAPSITSLAPDRWADATLIGPAGPGKAIVMFTYSLSLRYAILDTDREEPPQWLPSALPSPWGVFVNLAASPDGRSLAWIAPGDYGSATLWTSHIEGSGRRELAASPRTSGLGPEFLSWTPDGRRISFVYRSAIWTLPAK
jgi:Tol biopolymer transport system component